MSGRFVDGWVSAHVPATSANLGPGFDALGLALTLHDEVSARVTAGGLTVDVTGEGTGVARDERHLVVRAMRRGFEALGGQPAGIELRCVNRIPHSRGLGSSAAAIVAGLVVARGIVDGGDSVLPDADLLALAAEMEGHPDNVAPCLLGGCTVAWTVGGRAEALRLDVVDGVRPVVLVPPFEASTEQARGLLPDSVPHADAAYNAARAALLVAAITSAPQALYMATDDRLHQPYRAPAMPASAELVRALRHDGMPAVVSGAGPTVLVLARDQLEAERVVAPDGWRRVALGIERRRVRVVRS
jgi:homoserine kinase